METLSDKMITTHAFKGVDVREAINKTLQELTVENPDTINEYSNRRILESFKRNFGDALLGSDE